MANELAHGRHDFIEFVGRKVIGFLLGTDLTLADPFDTMWQ